MKEPPHGTTARYKRQCRCADCRKAIVDYQRNRRHGVRLKIPAEEVRAHVRMLYRRGLSNAEIEREAGLSPSTVYHVMHDKFPNCQRHVAEALFGVTGYKPREAGAWLRDATVAKRLVREMQKAGLTYEVIGAFLHRSYGWPYQITTRRRVSQTTHNRIVTLYRLLVREGVVPAAPLSEVEW